MYRQMMFRMVACSLLSSLKDKFCSQKRYEKNGKTPFLRKRCFSISRELIFLIIGSKATLWLIHLAVRNKAVQAGYGKRYVDVKAYCDDYGIKIPERKRHTTKYEWMAKLNERIKCLQNEITNFEKQLANTTSGLIIKNLRKQKEQAEKHIEKLEKFISQPEIIENWKLYIDAEMYEEKPEEIKTNAGGVGDDFDW